MKLYAFDNWKRKTITLQEQNLYEPLFEASLRKIKQDWNIIDAGANIGFYSILFASLANKGHVFAIECHPLIASILDKNIELQGLKNITVIRKALSDAVGEKVELAESTTSAGTSVDQGEYDSAKIRLIDRGISKLGLLRRRLLGRFKPIGLIETDTLDNLFYRKIRVDLIKVDIQGMENKALLRGGLRLLKHDRPMLLVELHRRRYFSQEGFLTSLRRMGYKLTVENLPKHPSTLFVAGEAV